jgi:tetratricopeptide repeat protein
MILAFLFGAFGAIVAEVLKRWQQWNVLSEKRFLALLKSIEFWVITVFLILLSGSVGVFEGTKTHPIDWSTCFFVGVGAISIVRNFFSGVAAHGGPRAKRRRLKRQLSRSRVPDSGLSGKGQPAKLEQAGDTRHLRDAALEALARFREPVLEETERALQKAIRLHPQSAEAHYILGVLLKERGRLAESGRAFQEAIRLNLQNAEAHYNLGVLLKERGRFEEAERAFQEAIRLNPQGALVSKSVTGLLAKPWGLEKLSSLGEKPDATPETPIGWRDIFN